MEYEIEVTKHRKEEVLDCNQEAMDDLDFKTNIAIHEASKWSDYIYQAIQFMQ